MEIYLGATGQNKLDLVVMNHENIFNMPHSIVVDGNAGSTLDEHMIIMNHFHQYVRNNMNLFESKEQIEEWVLNFTKQYPDLILIGDEIGSGVVPLDETEREYREIYGRIMCELTKCATRVTRIVCGVFQVIKD